MSTKFVFFNCFVVAIYNIILFFYRMKITNNTTHEYLTRLTSYYLHFGGRLSTRTESYGSRLWLECW